MSAIWGKVSFINKEIKSNKLLEMKDSYKTYKIDRYSEHYDKNFMMGCGIQYITKEASGERLPLLDRDTGICITSDCILDNRDELLKILNIGSNVPDGDIIYSAYLKWGKESFTRLRGIFSIAIYDIEKNELILVTDKTSSRCLYYYYDKGECIFSTIIETIKKVSNVRLELNEQYVCDFLSAPGLMPTVSAEDTPYTNVYKIEPATYMLINNSGIRKVTYWTPKKNRKKFKCSTGEEWGNEFKRIFVKGVSETLRSSGEIGISLSSGLDSSSVGGVAASILNKDSKKLYSYTYVPAFEETFEKRDYFVCNEENDVRKIVEMHPNIIPKFLCNEGKNCYDEIDKILDILEIPYKSFVNSPSLKEMYDKAYEDNCRVVLTGQYGNTTISYGKFEDILYDCITKLKFISFIKLLSRFCKNHRISRKKAFIYILSQVKDYWRYLLFGKAHYEVSNIINDKLIKDYNQIRRMNDLNIPMYSGMLLSEKEYSYHVYGKSALTYIGEVETKMSLSSGIVLRDPTRNEDIIEFCMSIPYKYFIDNLIPRGLVRNNLREYVPACLLDKLVRYGLQNSDWLFRINKNWLLIKEKIEDDCYRKEIEKYINMEEYRNSIKMNEERLSFQGNRTNEIMYIAVLSKFIVNKV